MTCMDLTLRYSRVKRIARHSKTYTSFVYAMCPEVFDKSYATYFSFDGSTRNYLQTLPLPYKIGQGFISKLSTMEIETIFFKKNVFTYRNYSQSR